MNVSVILILVVINRFSKIIYKREYQVGKLKSLSYEEIPNMLFMLAILGLICIIFKILA